MTQRAIAQLLVGRPTSDGAGVKLFRVISPNQRDFDPLLMLDEFVSDDSADYIAGFPEHPHRGFETVTYMLEGAMEHRDHMGNVGRINAGDVQWMSAGRGVIHSEMPLQKEGRMHGFQLWINLPASAKMKPAAYQELADKNIPHLRCDGVDIKVIAGVAEVGGQQVVGPVVVPQTDAYYFDIALDANSSVELPLPVGHQVLLYMFQGRAKVAGNWLENRRGAKLSAGRSVALATGENAARLLLIAGTPLGEPVVNYGPFVMNTEAEIHQAIRDYQNGQLTA